MEPRRSNGGIQSGDVGGLEVRATPYRAPPSSPTGVDGRISPSVGRRDPLPGLPKARVSGGTVALRRGPLGVLADPATVVLASAHSLPKGCLHAGAVALFRGV